MEKTTEDKEYLMQIGERIVLLRKAIGLTQVQLAEQIGSDDMQIRRIERGETNSSILMLRKIANILNVKLEELVKV